MKNIAVLKVIALTILTLGIYPIYWLARNRNYIEKDGEYAETKLPKWQWLIAMIVIVGAGFITALIFLLVAALNGSLAETGIIGANVTIIGVLLIAYGIWGWWIWRFAKVFETIVQGRLGKGWSSLLAIVAGPFVIAFFQFYINRLDQDEAKQTYLTSPGVIVLAALFTLMSIISVFSSVTNFETTNAELRADILKSQEQSSKILELNDKYSQCTEQLSNDYTPTGSSENEATFDAKSAECDEALKQYEKALDEYLKS